MTKKDYVAIAAVILGAKHLNPAKDARDETRRIIAKDLADVMQADSPSFDRARFLKACGVQS